MSALDELLALPDRKKNLHLNDWKQAGGHVVGYACRYVPEEIIHAAGIFPYRVEARGIAETDLADIYLHRFNCTFSRCILQAGLSGEYDFLDGFCLLNGCEQIRRLYEIWEKHGKTEHMYMVAVPHSVYDAGFEWYREEISNFTEKLSKDFGVKISNGDLEKSVRIYNESRRLIQQIYELRKADSVPVTGADAMRILLAGCIMPRDKYNGLLAEALDEIRKKNGIADYKARLMVGGSALDDPQLLEVIEGLGGVVVTDSLCFGSRQFLGLVEENGAPLDAIAKRYYYGNPCPRMMNEFNNRLKSAEDLAKGANVDGVILQKIVFCDNHAVESPMLADELEAKGIPVLILEREYMLSDIGRLKTRVEAFMERIARR